MTLEYEVLADQTEARQEGLRAFGQAKTAHLMFPPVAWLMASMSRKLSSPFANCLTRNRSSLSPRWRESA
jgi:hypothetical protein